MEPISLILVGLISFTVSTLTLFTGFGLGSILVATFIFFFPVEIAVAAAAIVHLANNLLKVGLLHRAAVPRILAWFGIPAVLAAFAGAFALSRVARIDPLLVWEFVGRPAVVTPIKVLMGLLVVGFAVVDLFPRVRQARIDPRWLPVGGAMSGFFGGLSGHQGAFRAAFLSRLDLEPKAYVGTQAVLAIMVDVARLLVYGFAFFVGRMALVSSTGEWSLVGMAAASAFAGVFVGFKMLDKTTIPALRTIIGVLLFVVGLGLGVGVL